MTAHADKDPSRDAPRDQSPYQVLLEITDAISRASSVPDAFRAFAPPLLRLTSSEFLNLSLHDSYRDRMITRYWKKNQESGEFGAGPVESTATGWAWKHQKPVSIPDTDHEPRFPACVPALRDHGVRSHTVIPVSTPERRFGAVGLGRSVPEPLKNADFELLSHVAKMVALVLEKEKTYQALEEQQTLVEIGRELSSNLQLDKLMPAILCSLRSIARCRYPVLSLLDDDGKNVRLYGDAREWESLVSGTTYPLERSLSRQAIRTRRVSLLTAADLREMKSPLAQSMYKFGIQSVCSVPLIAGNKVLGGLNAHTTTNEAFGSSEVEYLQRVAGLIAVALQNAHSYREAEQQRDQLAPEKSYSDSEVGSASRVDAIIGTSPDLKRVLDQAAIVAVTDSTVLITGETGTGKERIARAIHRMSVRKDRPFIKLNCAAIPTGLLESELFGHEKGAFTGAVSQKIGRLELADKGTILLDEIGDIPLELQPKLLRVLQDQEFERLGGTKTIRVDARVVAATNRDLAKAVEEKEFRSDLFYRLHVFPIHLPPLRDRRDDIPLLIRYFVKKSATRMSKRIDLIPDQAVEAMMNWPWPGNIRELENFIERSVILSNDNQLRAPLNELHQDAPRPASGQEGTLRDRERDLIIDTLRQTRGVLSGATGAAARLGLKRTTLQYKMQKLGITRGSYLD